MCSESIKLSTYLHLINHPNLVRLVTYASTLQLLVCLRMLIRRCVYENISKDEIQKLFPDEVLPELQRLLTLLLQKFQREWRADIPMDEVRNSIFFYNRNIYLSFSWMLYDLCNITLLKLIVFRFLCHA